jgi:hypothetical protein
MQPLPPQPIPQQQIQQFIQTHKSQLPTNPQLRNQLDRLCNQRDCDASQLYWYTDWKAAKAAAKASQKPILSLRLLGNLDDDLSCANSRFFRLALYPNAPLRQHLADRYILHWQSVRPVPKVTVDFGNGRRLERTITGNSIHYITTADGTPIDAIPGLYGPAAFLRQLQQIETFVSRYQANAAASRPNLLQQYHRDRLTALSQQWSADLTAIGINIPPSPVAAIPTRQPNNSPTAVEAGRLAIGKSRSENSLVLGLRSVTDPTESLSQITDRAAWSQLGQRHARDARLDANSRRLMQRKLGKSIPSIEPSIRAFETSMAIDSIRNEYLLHSQLHRWFAEAAPETTNLDRLNRRVYDQLFLTPAQDPWLGLVGPDAFSAIDGDGIR